jgi:hypothetical protein
MIWQWLKAVDIQQTHGNLIWSLIPYQWRFWWHSAVNEVLHIDVDVQQPANMLTDVTDKKNQLEKAIKKKLLKPLMDAVDEHMFFCVKCPWGCTEVYHKTGYLRIDVVVARLFGTKLLSNKCATGNILQEIQRKVNGIREDFLERTQDDCILYNPEWRILPSVSILKDGAPYVLTCRYHRKGSSSIYIHPPKNPISTTSSQVGNRLAPAVVSTRTVKPMKKHFSLTPIRCMK